MRGKKQLIAFLSATMAVQMLPNEFIHVIAKEENSVQNEKGNQFTYQDTRNYWKKELLGEMNGIESDEVLNANIKKIDVKAIRYLDTMTLDENELWANDEVFMNFEAGARVTELYDRLKMIAIQTLEPNSSLYENEKAIEQVKKGLRFGLDKKYGPTVKVSWSNWWDKEIGAPKALVDLAILYYDQLDETTLKDVTATIDRFVPKADYRLNYSLKETGANLVDKVAIVIKRAALDGNEERMLHAKTCMTPLFSYSNSGDGYYPDGSFIQHNNIAYNGSYGYVLLNELTNCILMLSFTDYKIDQKDIEFYENTLLNHYIPFLSYGGNMVDGVRGRAVSRKAQQGDTMGVQTMGVLLQYADIAATKKTKEAIYNGLKGIANQKFKEEQTQDFSLLAYSDYIRVKNLANNDVATAMERNSYHVYSYMDRIVSQRDDYTFTVSANSSRMVTEQGNAENILGRYQGQGYTQIYNNDINQYNENYNATVDQKRLAGVTTAHQDLGFQSSGQSRYSGGSTLDGVNGVSGFELTGEKQLTKLNGGFGSESDTGVKSGITAKKSYFVFGDKIVYLGSGISNQNTDPNVDYVESIVENRKTFDGMQLSIDGKAVVNENGTTNIVNPKSAYLSGKNAESGIGYVFLEDATLDVKKETRSGSWHDVNQLAKFTDTMEVSNDYISMAVNHGTNPKDATYSWIVLPNASEEEVSAYLANPTIEVIENNSTVQAVRDTETQQSAYNFFASGATSDNMLEVTGPASIVMKKTSTGVELAVSDPTRTQSSVDIQLKGAFADLSHIGITNGSAEVVSTDKETITIRVNFSSKDGQPRKIEAATVFETSTDNLALDKSVEASSVVQNAATQQRLPKFAVDGDIKTRWASNYERGNPSISKEEADTGWFAVDLGEKVNFNRVKISWEWALSNDYEIQISNDETNDKFEDKEWTTVATKKANTGYKAEQRMDEITFDEVSARYIRLKSNLNSRPLDPKTGTAAGGLSIYEFEVYNSINLAESVEKAEQLLNDYPEASAFATPEQFETLKKNLENALNKAKIFMIENPNYTDEELKGIACDLEKAIQEYDRAVLHVTSIAINDIGNVPLDKNEQRKLDVTISPTNAYIQDVEWMSSHPKVANVDENGVVTGVSSGETIITVTSKDNGMSDSVKITVSVKPKKITLDKNELEMKKGESSKINATISPIEAQNTELMYISTNEDVMSVSGDGTIQAVGVGEADVIVSSVDDPSVAAVCRVTVKANLVVSSENLALLEGRKTSASSTVSVAGVSSDNAVDGSYETRWASDYKNISEEEAEKQWWMVELPEVITFNHIDITWFSETVYGKEFKILVSEDGVEWKEAYHETDGKNKKYSFDFPTVSGKYVKFQGIKRTAPKGGYGIVEFEIYNKMDYDKIITEAKNIMNLYPAELTGKQEEYTKLSHAVENAEKLIEENPNFSQEQLKEVLVAVNEALEAYKAFIVPVNSISGGKTTLFVNETGTVPYTINPENATNQEVVFENKNPDIISLDADGNVRALKKGVATVAITTKDGLFVAESVIEVKSNTVPVINASDITITVGDVFDPLKYASAIDEEDGVLELTLENVVENTVDTSKAGEGSVTYRVTDSDGNTVEKTITVTVKEDEELQNAVKDLKEAVEKAKSIDENKFTPESVEVLKGALKKAEEVLNDENATLQEVMEATAQLNVAFDQLIEKEVEVPTDPENPTDPQEPSDPEEDNSANTSDTSKSVFYTVALTISGFFLAFLTFFKKKKDMKEE